MPQSKVLSFAIYTSMILMAGIFALFIHQTPVEAAVTVGDPCHLYNSSVPIPNPFGTAYNLFSSTQEQLLSAGCSSDTMVEVIAGNGEPNTYVYNKGYYLFGSEWREFTMSCTDGNLLVNAWCVGSAETSIPSAPTADGRGYFVGYTCQWIDNSWKCGCQDSTCATPQWQLQAYAPAVPPATEDNSGGDPAGLDSTGCPKDSPGWPTSRSNMSQWPFTADSIWNTPIGCEARYVNAQLDGPHQFGPNTERHFITNSSMPKVEFLACNDGGKCWQENVYTRCTGDTPILWRFGGAPLYVNFPRNELVDTDCCDNPTTITTPDGRYIYQTGAFARCEIGGPIYGVSSDQRCQADLMGDGFDCPGAYGGSRIMMWGGTMKYDDWKDDSPIKHAGAIWLKGFQSYVDRNNPERTWRWPAFTTDVPIDPYPDEPCSPVVDPTNLPSSYVEELVMGALLAIPRGVTPADLNIQSEPGLKFFNMAQDYGIYYVNGSGKACATVANSISMSPDAQEVFESRYGHPFRYSSPWPNNENYPPIGSDWRKWMEDVQAIMEALHVVDDNAENNIGGAGTERMRPPAPPF